ncbi:MAG: RNA methyltransferase [Planctomycetia bacterium]|nr:RNA methyltransferase [Planctomycetia bacterium]
MNEPESITSPANPRVKQAAALRDAEPRRATGLTLVDGRRELARAEAAGAVIVEVFVAGTADAIRTADAPPLHDWLARLAQRGTRIATLSDKAFDRVAFGSRNEGVVGVVRFGPRPLDEVAFATDRPVLVVEGVEKPGNLGAIIRTADAAGLGGVIASSPRTDVANPAVIRASLGTVFSMPLATASTEETLAWCRRQARRVVAATPAGQRLWHEADLRGNVAILLGSEAHGLSSAWAAADGLPFETVRLPMHGLADSLNLSVTAAVLAYEAVRQRGART